MPFSVIITPIEYLFDAICYWVYDVYRSEIIALLFLSVFVNILTQPLYAMAERVSNADLEKKKSFLMWEEHIKKAFKGSERSMMIAALYKKYDYNPVLGAISGIVPLLLQIPFFMAAYDYLSLSSILLHVGYLGMDSLSVPDRLIAIGDFKINILPIIMTVINLLSVLIYTHGKAKKEMIQPVILAFIFLVILYDSPAGLVLYWIMNNVFSLFRNIIDKGISDKGRLFIFLSVLPFGIFAFFDVLIIGNSNPLVDYDCFGGIMLIIPVLYIAGQIGKSKGKKSNKNSDQTIKHVIREFLPALIAFVLLMGGVIPARLISVSPIDFVDYYHFSSPLKYVAGTAEIFLGAAFWVLIAFCLSDSHGKKKISFFIYYILFASLIHFAFFGNNIGVINKELVYDSFIVNDKEIMISCCIMIALAVLLKLLWNAGTKYWWRIGTSIIVALLGLMVYDMTHISRTIASEKEKIVYEDVTEEAVFSLSGNSKNVIIIMLDRAIGAYLPYFIAEKPELKEKLSGFTYYPDTLSFAMHTNQAAPALFGGYEYTPWELNRRNNELMSDKHDEALSVMPLIFGEEGFEVTVADLPYAGYSEVPDMSCFDKYSYVKTCHLEGKFSDLSEFMSESDYNDWMKRRFSFYAIMRGMPRLFSKILYSRGDYLQCDEQRSDLYMRSYGVLCNLSHITRVQDDLASQLIIFANNTTHDVTYYQMPDYIATDKVDNSLYIDNIPQEVNGNYLKMDRDSLEKSYCSNMAALLKLGEYFDYLKEQGVYDNTRIIIVADHGQCLAQLDNMIIKNGIIDIMSYNPLLLVKDFDSKEFMISSEYMTNADVPALAMKGIIEDPINPFTSKLINMDSKKNEQYVTESDNWAINDGYILDISDAPWYTVKDSIFLEQNWNIVE